MSSQPFVLYCCLLDDLSRHLPPDVISSLRRGESVDCWPDITPKQFACLSLAKAFYKKFIDETDSEADARALSKFLSVNEQCGAWSEGVLSSWDEELLGTVKRHLENFFYLGPDPILSNLTDLFEIGRNGPGSSIGSVGQDEYTKLYSSTLTCTSKSIYRAYRASLSPYPLLLDAEFVRLKEYGQAKLVEGNRLSFVPKQRAISRVICVEPVLNMYAQLGIGSILESRLRSYFGIDIATQPDYNKELARLGSIDGSFATIDLSSASDSLSLRMLEYILPRNVLDFLVSVRSRTCELPDGKQVALNMISTMGNGYTFPLQTILFSAVVSAVYEQLSVKRERNRKDEPGNWGVFGDDIIVKASCFRRVSHALGLLGFKLNAEKSFNEGPFRESCGNDYFRGHPVRGVYVKTLLTPQARAVVLNRLHEWSAMTGVVVSSTTRYLYSTLPRRFVPVWESYDAGIRVPFSFVEGMRRSKHLQSVIYSAWVPRRRVLSIRDLEGLTRKKRIYNQSGLYACFLRGHIRNEQISLRQRETLYVTKSRVAPSWDLPRKLLVTETSWRRWNNAVWLTLSG